MKYLLLLIVLAGCTPVQETVYVEMGRLKFEDCYTEEQTNPDEECLKKWQDQFDECYLDLDDNKLKCCIDNYCFIQ